MAIESSLSVAYTTVIYHGIAYIVDDYLNFYVLDANNKWRLVDANRIPEDVVELYRECL